MMLVAIFLSIAAARPALEKPNIVMFFGMTICTDDGTLFLSDVTPHPLLLPLSVPSAQHGNLDARAYALLITSVSYMYFP